MSPEEVETLTYKSVRVFRAWAEVICYRAACSFPSSQLWVGVDTLVVKRWNLQGWFGAGRLRLFPLSHFLLLTSQLLQAFVF